ncbi:MAG: 30S ribosome-binding factor RbfA [Chitinivibrionales bacterium]|nr:30S ribosome-binding factor RbfA [Chitinivibrionales bacterium]
MTSPQYHIHRLKELLHREVGRAISTQVRDPRVPPLLTITDVTISPDSRNATVYVHIQSEEVDKEEAVRALNKAAPFIQKFVAGRVSTRRLPKLYFKIDTSLDRGYRVDELLRDMENDLD